MRDIIGHMCPYVRQSVSWGIIILGQARRHVHAQPTPLWELPAARGVRGRCSAKYTTAAATQIRASNSDAPPDDTLHAWAGFYLALPEDQQRIPDNVGFTTDTLYGRVTAAAFFWCSPPRRSGPQLGAVTCHPAASRVRQAAGSVDLRDADALRRHERRADGRLPTRGRRWGGRGAPRRTRVHVSEAHLRPVDGRCQMLGEPEDAAGWQVTAARTSLEVNTRETPPAPF